MPATPLPTAARCGRHRPRGVRGLVLGVLLGASTLAPAWGLEGLVLRVSDGDSFWLRPAPGKRPLRVRIQGIDAPEICQPGGPQAQQALERLLLGRHVVLHLGPTDRYGRRLASVMQAQQDVAAVLVRQGWAWNDDFHGKGRYADEELAARKAQLGLFALATTQRPAQFRQQHGACVSLSPPKPTPR